MIQLPAWDKRARESEIEIMKIRREKRGMKSHEKIRRKKRGEVREDKRDKTGGTRQAIRQASDRVNKRSEGESRAKERKKDRKQTGKTGVRIRHSDWIVNYLRRTHTHSSSLLALSLSSVCMLV